MNNLKLKNLKNILFYIEPWVELSTDFRLGVYGHYNHLRTLLLQEYDHLNIQLLVSDVLYEEIQKKQPSWLHNDIKIIPLDELNNIYNDYREAATYNYHNCHDNKKSIRLISLIKKTLKDWEPELIIMHETHAPFLKETYPSALILHAMYGMTFKEPYPQTYLFDAKGLYSNSIFNSEDVLYSIEISTKDIRILKQIKNWYAQQIVPHDPVWGTIEKYQSRFEKLILLPLQVDGYYAFDECSNYKNQLEFLTDVLNRVPKTWGIVVTRHSNYDSSITQTKFLKLKLTHENLIQLDAFDNIPYVSQALLPHMDAVISISSSLALQTLLFNKPLILAGDSHINKIATCTLEKISEVFNKPYDETTNFKILKFFFLKYHLLHHSKVENPKFLYQYLNEYFQNWQLANNDTPAMSLLPELYTSLDKYFEDVIKVSQWRKWNSLLEKQGIVKDGNPIFIDILYHDFISWDLFDTLVDRPFIQPHELFQAIEDNVKCITNNVYMPFAMIRRESERVARIRFANNRREVKFNEIYTCLAEKSRLSNKHIEVLKNLELDTEKSCIKPRRLMKKTWEFAKIFGKTRSIITDIYLDKDFIEDIVSVNGYGDYDQLLVSSETRTRKEDGSIFPEYILIINETYGKGKLLHIGDNPRADGEMARKHGIAARLIPKAMDQLRNSYYAKLLKKPLHHNSYDTSLITGLIANKFFSSPKSHFNNESIANHDLYNLGYSIVGPFLVSYIQWVIRRLQKHQVERVFFLARDGYLIMKVYEVFKSVFAKLPEHRYLLCSRRGVVVPGIFDIDNIFETAMLNYGITTVENFLSSRFGLSMNDIPKKVLKKYHFKEDGSTKIHFPDDLGTTNSFVIDIQDIILAKAKEERELYHDYLKEEGMLDDVKTAMVDIGYSGTMQRKIKSITGKSFVGLYMLTHNYVLPSFRHEVFEGWLADYDNQRSSIRHIFNEYIPLLESMLSSDAGSFVNFYLDEEGKCQVNYLYSQEEDSRCFFVRNIQQGALDFANDFVERLQTLALDIELSPSVGGHLMFEFGSTPTPTDVNLFEGLLLENMFAGAEFSVIANAHPFLNSSGYLNKENYNYLVNQSKWKAGAVIAYQKYLDTATPKSTSSIQLPSMTNQSQSAHQLPEVMPNIQKANNLTRKERLNRKLHNNPRLFIEDLRYLPKFIKKILISNSFTLNYSQRIIQKLIS